MMVVIVWRWLRRRRMRHNCSTKNQVKGKAIPVQA